MTDSLDPEVGYGKPPKHTRFTKGKSGNPGGRPKGSKNLATLLNQAGQERVNVTANGKTKLITKSKATVTQLANKAASGDLKAINLYLHWSNVLANAEQNGLPPSVLNESDTAVMASISKRFRQSEEAGSSDPPESPAPDISEKEV